MDEVVEGNCYVSGRLQRCCIGIENGRIVQVAKDIECDKRYTFSSGVVLPAAIDVHVHFREPGMTNKEDFATGSLSSLHGGVTCFFDMPNTKPQTTSLSTLKEKKSLAAAKSLVDFGLYAGIRPGVDVSSMAPAVVGFKLYMAHSTGDMGVGSLDDVGKELGAISRTDKVLAVHAEDEALRKKEIEAGLEDHLRNRCNECEANAIRRAIDAAANCRLHICHVSAKESLAAIGTDKVTSEVTPHHLLLDKDSRLGTMGKVNPPLRTRADRYAMVQHMKEGGFDIISSDHSPHTLEEKSEEFDYAPSGLPGTETLVPLMLRLVEEKHLTLEGLVSRLCERPAEIFGISKGRIAVGCDADLIYVDMGASEIVRADNLHSKCCWTPYEGLPAIFPKAVFLRGELMVQDGHLVGEGSGRDVIDVRL